MWLMISMLALSVIWLAIVSAADNKRISELERKMKTLIKE